jgi:hypothetical protein
MFRAACGSPDRASTMMTGRDSRASVRVQFCLAMKASEIITAVVALYGAVLSTVALAKQLASDRISVTLRVKPGMQISTTAPYLLEKDETSQPLRKSHRGSSPRYAATAGRFVEALEYWEHAIGIGTPSLGWLSEPGHSRPSRRTDRVCA